MATFKKFEDIEAWKLAREICKEVHEIISVGMLAKDFELRGQMKRSSGSMMDNIAEGFERDGVREFIQFLAIGKASSGELKSQLYRTLDNKYIDEKKFETIFSKTDNYGKMVGKLINYLNTTDIKGAKFKNKTPVSENPKPETSNP
jgi:four helix bundle protein